MKVGVKSKRFQSVDYNVAQHHHVRVGLEETSKPTRRVITTVSGKNIGYGSTCECLVQAGLVILQEEDKLPNAGGVYSPGYAFAETSLTDRLTEKGVTFRTVVQEIQ